MRVIDFIRENSDCMNERDYFDTLNGLADAYGNSISKKDVRLSEKTLLAHFFVQELIKTHTGKYAFKRDPAKTVPKKNLVD